MASTEMTYVLTSSHSAAGTDKKVLRVFMSKTRAEEVRELLEEAAEEQHFKIEDVPLID